MDRIIDELLLLSSVRKVEEVAMDPLDMTDIVTEVQERLANMIEEYQAHVVLPEAWPMALGHAPWVEEIWANYISNAIKYGGQPPHVELGADAVQQANSPHDTVRFWVRDNGPGIASERHGELFTEFTRLSQMSVTGHGLGLSIVQRIAGKLGGQVGVESQPDQGSLFFFTLPAADKASRSGR
jgi:signal transduction histidine kinase